MVVPRRCRAIKVRKALVVFGQIVHSTRPKGRTSCAARVAPERTSLEQKLTPPLPVDHVLVLGVRVDIAWCAWFVLACLVVLWCDNIEEVAR